METVQQMNQTPLSPIHGLQRETNGSDKKTTILIRAMIVSSIILTCAAYIFGVQQQKKTNPAFMDPITQLKATFTAPKINKEGPPGIPGGWVAPMPSTTP